VTYSKVAASPTAVALPVVAAVAARMPNETMPLCGSAIAASAARPRAAKAARAMEGERSTATPCAPR
jgi:hypothetical protein